MSNQTAQKKYRKILVLADESAFWNIGGLLQLDRIILNVMETFPDENKNLENLFVFWKNSVPGKNQYVLKHRSLRGKTPQMEENALKLKDWLSADREPLLILQTTFLLGRGTLKKFPVTDVQVLKDLEVLDCESQNEKATWELIAGRLASHPEVGPLKDVFFKRIEHPSQIKEAEKALFKTLSKPTDGLISTVLNRPLSTRLSRLLVHTWVTPTIWTFFLFGVALFGVWLLTLGTQAGFILGTLFYQMVSALDGCDGELARVRFQESRTGEWIDTLSDLSGNILFLAALGIGLSRQEGIAPLTSWLFFWEGIFTALALLGTLWGVHLFTKKREDSGHFNNFGKSAISEMKLPGWLTRLSLSIARVLKRDTYMLLFFFMALFGKTEWILHLMGLGILLHLAVLLRPVFFPPVSKQAGEQHQA